MFDGAIMTIKEIEDRDAFTTRALIALATARADGNGRSAWILLDALFREHGLTNRPLRESRS